MISAAKRWLGQVPSADPFERRTAMAAQVFCIGLTALLVVGEVLRAARGQHEPFNTIANLLTIAVSVTAVGLIRRGRVRDAYALVIAGFVATLSVSLAARGLEYHRIFLHRVFGVLLVLAALLHGRRALWATLGTLLAAMLIGRLRDDGAFGGPVPQSAMNAPLGIWGQAIAVMLLLAAILDRFGAALAEAYAAALGRQREAERATEELRAAKESLEAEMERRREAESLLFQSQKLEAIGRLSGGVAHDFNNLLTAILGFTHLSLDAVPPGDPRRKHLEGVIQASLRGADLTRQLLAFARKQIVEPKVIRVDDGVRTIEPMIRRLIGENVKVELALGAGQETVLIDPVQFEQVLVNLAVNARDAMPGGGTLRFETDAIDVAAGGGAEACGLQPGRHVRIRVSDTGEGMSAETLKNVFEPFFTTKAVGAGTGLGLATCYGIVRQARGSITVKSAPGQGATFEICLPVAGDGAAAAPVPSRFAASGGPETILVVEDHPQVLDLVARVLRDRGYHVMTASDPAAAMTLLREFSARIDLLLTDVVLPGSDGRTLAESLVGLQPQVAILYMSGHSDDIIARHGVLEHGIELLPKPFSPDELVQRVRTVLDARRNRG